MRHVLLVLLVAGLAATAALPRAAHAARYTLAELIAQVSASYPGVVAGRESVESARANLLAAQRLWMPSGEMTLSLSGTPKVRCLDRLHEDPALRTGPGQDVPYADQTLREANCVRTTVVDLQATPLSQLLPFQGVALGLNVYLNQTLYSFGKFEAQIASAKANIEAQEAALERERAEVVWNVTRAYWGIKATRAALDTLAEGVEKLREWKVKIDTDLGGKNPSKYTTGDLARIKVALANAEILVLDQERNRFYAEQALRILVGDPSADVDEAEIDLDDAELGLDEWQGRALRLRPEIRGLAKQLKVQTTIRKLRIAEFLPDLTLNSWLNYGYASAMDTPQNYFLGRPNVLNFTFTLMLRQPLDFGVRAARYLRARHDEAASAARERAGIVTYSTEIARAFADWEEARGRAKQTKRAEKVSRGWYNSVDQSLSSGLITDGREMVEAAQNYFTFRLRQLQAIFDANVQLAFLRRTTGVTEAK